MTIGYPEETRTRLGDYSPEELRDFALNIPASKLQKILNRLPSLKGGFRPGKDTPVRLLSFFGKMSRWTEDEWEIMADIWMLWTETHRVFRQTLRICSNSEIDVLVQSMMTSAEARRGAIIKLIQAAREGYITRGMILNWYKFGPFPSDTEVMDLIELAPMQEESYLPTRLNAVEQKVSQLEQEYQKLRIDVKTIQSNYRVVAKLRTDLSELVSKFRILEEQTQQFTRRLRQMGEAIDLVNKKIDALSTEKKGLRTELNQLREQVAVVQQGLVDIQENSLFMVETYNRLDETAGSLQAKLTELQGTVDSLNQEIRSGGGAQGRCDPVGIAPMISTMTVQSCHTDSVVLESARAIIAHLEKNLNGLGIKLTNARRLASEVVAALAAGQLVAFNGSLGFTVAERCALSLAGGTVDLIRIPVGLLYGFPMERQLQDWINNASIATTTVALIFEGINRSALEVYGAALRQLVIERLFRLRQGDLSLLLFATLEEGPAAIPWGKEILELGPIFTSDALGWMDKSATPGVPGKIPREVWLEITRLPETKPDWEEFMLPDWLLHEGGALWRRTVLMAVLFHMKLTSDTSGFDDTPKPAAFGWVLPMMLKTRPDRLAEVLELVDPDDRLKNLLLRSAPEVIQT